MTKEYIASEDVEDTLCRNISGTVSALGAGQVSLGSAHWLLGRGEVLGLYLGLYHAACHGIQLPQSPKADQGLGDLVLKMEMLILKMNQFLKSQSKVGTVDPSVA